MASDEAMLQQELAALQRELAPLEAQLAARRQAQEAELAALRAEGEALTERLAQADRDMADLGARLGKAESALATFRGSPLGEMAKLVAAQRSLIALFFLMVCAALWTLFALRHVLELGVVLQAAGLLLGLWLGRRRPRRRR